MSSKYWGECLLAATHIINKLPSTVLQYKTPHELLYNTKPDYSVLKAFGCLAYASTHSNDKFASRAIQCVFVGYPHLQKGYKLLRLDNHVIFVSRHVKFVESVFPYHHFSKSNLPSTNTTVGNSYLFLNWLKSHNLNGHTDANISSSVSSHSDSMFNSSFTPSSSHSDSINAHSSDSLMITHPEKSVESVNDHFSSGHVLNQSPSVPTQVSVPIVRQSTRTKDRPTWWTDYHVSVNNTVTDSSPSMDSFNLQLEQFTFDGNSQVFTAYNSSAVEPNFYHQAVRNPLWIDAMDKELAALNSNNTWTLVPFPEGKKTIGCKWVYKLKHLLMVR